MIEAGGQGRHLHLRALRWRGQGDRDHRRSCRDQKDPRSSRAPGRGYDARVLTLCPSAATSTIAGLGGTRLTAAPSLTPGRKAGLTLRQSVACACWLERSISRRGTHPQHEGGGTVDSTAAVQLDRSSSSPYISTQTGSFSSKRVLILATLHRHLRWRGDDITGPRRPRFQRATPYLWLPEKFSSRAQAGHRPSAWRQSRADTREFNRDGFSQTRRAVNGKMIGVGIEPFTVLEYLASRTIAK